MRAARMWAAFAMVPSAAAWAQPHGVHPPVLPVNLTYQMMAGGESYEFGQRVVRDGEGNLVVAGSSYSVTIPGVPNKGASDFYVIRKKPRGEELAWQRMYGGSSSDMLHDACATADGGCILAGDSLSTDIQGAPNNGGQDMYLVKIDSGGGIEWQTLYGEAQDDCAIAVRQTPDGGYAVAGITRCNDLRFDISLWKLDAGGGFEWMRLYEGDGGDQVRGMEQTADGGFILVGFSDSADFCGAQSHGSGDLLLLKAAADGAVEWARMYGTADYEAGFSVRQAADGGCVVAGFNSETEMNGWVLRLDAQGEVLWDRSCGGEGEDSFVSVHETADGGFVAAGSSGSRTIPGCTHRGLEDAYLVKLGAGGGIAWQRMFGGSGDDILHSVLPLAEGGFVAAGSSKSRDIPGVANHGRFDYYLMRLNREGRMVGELEPSR